MPQPAALSMAQMASRPPIHIGLPLLAISLLNRPFHRQVTVHFSVHNVNYRQVNSVQNVHTPLREWTVDALTGELDAQTLGNCSVSTICPPTDGRHHGCSLNHSSRLIRDWREFRSMLLVISRMATSTSALPFACALNFCTSRFRLSVSFFFDTGRLSVWQRTTVVMSLPKLSLSPRSTTSKLRKQVSGSGASFCFVLDTVMTLDGLS